MIRSYSNAQEQGDECNLHVGVSLRCLFVHQHCEKLVTWPQLLPSDPPPVLQKKTAVRDLGHSQIKYQIDGFTLKLIHLKTLGDVW